MKEQLATRTILRCPFRKTLPVTPASTPLTGRRTESHTATNLAAGKRGKCYSRMILLIRVADEKIPPFVGQVNKKPQHLVLAPHNEGTPNNPPKKPVESANGLSRRGFPLPFLLHFLCKSDWEAVLGMCSFKAIPTPRPTQEGKPVQTGRTPVEMWTSGDGTGVKSQGSKCAGVGVICWCRMRTIKTLLESGR